MIYLMLLGALLVGAVWGIYYRCQWAKDVTVRLWFETDAVYAGQETKL